MYLRRVAAPLRTLLASKRPPIHSFLRCVNTEASDNEAKRQMNADIAIIENHKKFSSQLDIISGMTNEKELQFYDRLTDAEITFKWPLSLLLYVDMRNPIFNKYELDFFEFVDGCKQAFKKTLMDISSKEFYNSCKGFIRSSVQDDFLRDILHPRLYISTVDAIKDAGHNEHFQSFLENVSIMKAIITNIKVHVVDENELKFIDKLKESDLNYETTYKPSVDPPVGTDDAELQSRFSKLVRATKEYISYPLGSVLVTVETLIDTEESYIYTSKGGGSTDVESHADPQSLLLQAINSKPVIRKDSNIVTFRGCISNHVPLEWKIVGLHGITYV